MLTLSKRKKTNFMIDIHVLQEIKEFIPDGERSDFLNYSIQRGLEDFRNKVAFEGIREMRKKAKLKMTTEEFIKLKNYGRE